MLKFQFEDKIIRILLCLYSRIAYLCTIKLNIKSKNKKKMPKKQTFTSEFEQMKVGDTKDYPASRYTSVRSLASTMSFMLNRKYSTCIDRERRIVTVTRIQ